MRGTPADPSVTMLEVFGRRAEDHQPEPLSVRVGGDVMEAFAHWFEASQIMMRIEQAVELAELGGLEQAHFDFIEQALLIVIG